MVYASDFCGIIELWGSPCKLRVLIQTVSSSSSQGVAPRDIHQACAFDHEKRLGQNGTEGSTNEAGAYKGVRNLFFTVNHLV